MSGAESKTAIRPGCNVADANPGTAGVPLHPVSGCATNGVPPDVEPVIATGARRNVEAGGGAWCTSGRCVAGKCGRIC